MATWATVPHRSREPSRHPSTLPLTSPRSTNRPRSPARSAHSVNENVEDFSHTYTASDPEGDSTTFTWSLAGSDGSDFAIDRNKGILTFRSTPDYESPADSNRNNEYLVQVGASDGQFTGTLAVTVTVNDVNEPPTITGDDTPPDFPENSTRSVATYRATDPERATIIWTLAETTVATST